MRIEEKIDLEKITKKYYSFNLYRIEGKELLLQFDDIGINFNGYSIFKCGYPNEEIYLHSEFVYKNHVHRYVLYEIIESDWIAELKEMNKVHPRNSDLVFKDEKHYAIYFEDEVFECIADSYSVVEIPSNKN